MKSSTVIVYVTNIYPHFYKSYNYQGYQDEKRAYTDSFLTGYDDVTIIGHVTNFMALSPLLQAL